jgi:peptide/nickel transport system permease protein
MTLAFLLTRLSGDLAISIAGPSATQADVEIVRKAYGLDRPLYVQFFAWTGRAIVGDFGQSYFFKDSVANLIQKRLPITLTLGLVGLSLALIISLPLGILAAIRENSWIDRSVTMFTMVGQAIPSFWLALILILQFAVYRNILPSRGFVKFSESPTEWFEHLLLPWITLGTLTAATIARQLRGALADTMSSDHIRTSRSVGLPSTKVVGKHALKNSSAPVLTVVGLQVAYLLGGTVVVESIFGIAGLGTYVLTAVQQNDLPAIQASVLFIAILTVLVNLMVDISYAILNPKVRVE